MSAIMMSFKLTCEYKADIRSLEALYSMIVYIRDNIGVLIRPLPDIFQSYQNDYLEKNGFLPSVRSNGLYNAWKNQIMLSHKNEAYPLISEFSSSIGGNYCAEEVRLCDYTIERLGKLIEKNKAESKGKIKLYRTVPVLIALSVILILI